MCCTCRRTDKARSAGMSMCLKTNFGEWLCYSFEHGPCTFFFYWVRWLATPYVLQPWRHIVLARLWKFPLAPPGAPTPMTTRQTSSRQRGNCGWEMAGNIANKWQISCHLKGSFTCCKSVTWNRWLYFPSKGRHAEDFFRPEKSDGFGWVRTPKLGYQRLACYPQTTEAAALVPWLSC
jgi:hypothetical protein